MQKILLSLLLSALLLFCFSQQQDRQVSSDPLAAYKAGSKIYETAHQQSIAADYNEAMGIRADSSFLAALGFFNSIVPTLRQNRNDSLLFFVKIKTGYIHYYFDSLNLARQDYLEAIALKKNLSQVEDSFLFVPCLFTGGIYYTRNQFDSALFFYKRAEQIADSYQKKLSESERLYNRTGVMYYETGNYRQARNYFEKAILLTDPRDAFLVTNYKINIASILIKLDSLDAAEKLYHTMLPSEAYQNEINHNLAIISIKKQDYHQAINYLRKINYANDKKSIDLYYNFGAAFSALNQHDSAEFYLQRAIAENLRWNGKRKNVQYGLILKYQADELTKQKFFKEALSQYQSAILQFVTDYQQTDPSQNPKEFQSAFSYINLFNTLAAKANALENWYELEKNNKYLESALDAYRSAFNLAAYVERTYDSDEARLFLGKIKHQVHNKPINICIELYDLTKKRSYLEEAYLFDQRNKASTLSLNVQQHEYRRETGNQNPLLKQEMDLRKSITRLSIRAGQITDSIQLSGIISEIRDKEIELGKTRKKLYDDPVWKERLSSDLIPVVNALQKKLDHNTALLSYHLSENGLVILLITQSRFEYHRSLINKSFFSSIESFKNILHNTSSNERFNGTPVSTRLYEKLIEPIYDKLIAIKRLIIIPDDELHYLPFEALQNENKNYLLERFSIQYQYSTALLERPLKKEKLSNTLVFAPFAGKGFTDSSGIKFSALPSSSDEIKGLPGISYIDDSATKQTFLKSVNQFHVIHLATHAIVDNSYPSRSFVAFSPAGGNYKLFAPEIADLQLDSARLVILSACETGSGQLVKGEGLMSLSRAFAYAGCPDIITSLWKAEDRTTAFLTRQLHTYLQKGFTKDRALQQAKLDLLANDQIDPRFKSPVYWAHLIFIGEYERTEKKATWWWIAVAFIVGALIYKLLGKKKEE